ncbi:ATP-binding protein [Dellaglioa algida]|uniref:ATP-binding protein n=1 Tax=Dellaglioa algida TaxID=105612 RepID=UPI0024C4CD7D|nr:ATP-binding protein [Dellaglioa algida]MDK1716591.1 putative DNA binding domain-containing protein [Dellaglioa algida]MDK1721533.1 putative DNA binding domain-containing protein [Dellaglioa algida]
MQKKELMTFIQNHDESEVLDYKENLVDPLTIGEYISALGNSAMLIHNPSAYMIWGVEDISKSIVGTTFNPQLLKASDKNNMPFITYLEKFLEPHIMLNWESFTIENRPVILLTIDVTNVNRPIKFKGKAFIRSGSSKTSLTEFPEKERLIWKSFESSKFELEFAKTGLTWDEVLSLLDIELYRQAIQSDNITDTISSMITDNILCRSTTKFNITNLGAYTLALDLSLFSELARRTIRIVKYNGNHNYDPAVSDTTGKIGIGISFPNMVTYTMSQLPYKEDYMDSIRRNLPMFPKIAIRELIANALVHQNFNIHGSRPLVEIYDNRIEISNPGAPIIEPERFLDSKPKSRNDELANLLGKLHVVESRGTGIDKVVNSLEQNALPALSIIIQGSDTTVIKLSEKKKFKDMSITEKNQSIYWHSCLRYVEDLQIDNKTLRNRFKLDGNSTKLMSYAIINAQEANLIKPYDPNAGRKFMKYIPFWGLDITEK